MSHHRIARAAALTFTAVVLIVSGCSSASDHASAPKVPPVPAVKVVELNPELDHLHGLHIGAAGTIVAGTHSGLFAIDPSGVTSRVGGSDDDFMGLTGVPGSDLVFASGHPGESSSAPNPLGLRHSADGGQTWVDKSLVGDVDFHALVTDGVVVAGSDGTTILVSADAGTTWASGAAMRVASLAITESGVWAVTDDGLQHSTDGARSFSVEPDAPSLVILAGAGDALWGIDVEGNAWRSREGQDWQVHSYVGSVEALTAANYDTAYAATTRSLYTLD